MSLISPNQAILSDAQAKFDAIITEWGVLCKVFYNPIWQPCPNCVPDLNGQKSSNHWLDGGPIPFQDGQICPMCDGQFLRSQEVSDTFKMRVYYDTTKLLRQEGINLNIPDGGVATKLFMSDAPKVQQCIKMQTSCDNPIISSFYEKDSRGFDRHAIFQGRYCYYVWRRVS